MKLNAPPLDVVYEGTGCQCGRTYDAKIYKRRESRDRFKDTHEYDIRDEDCSGEDSIETKFYNVKFRKLEESVPKRRHYYGKIDRLVIPQEDCEPVESGIRSSDYAALHDKITRADSSRESREGKDDRSRARCDCGCGRYADECPRRNKQKERCDCGCGRYACECSRRNNSRAKRTILQDSDDLLIIR